MKHFTVRNFDKWLHQNGAKYTGAFFEGVLLDNFVLDCKRGYAAVYERYVNPNMSEYEIRFAPYRDKEAISELWGEFYGRYDEHEGSAA